MKTFLIYETYTHHTTKYLQLSLISELIYRSGFAEKVHDKYDVIKNNSCRFMLRFIRLLYGRTLLIPAAREFFLTDNPSMRKSFYNGFTALHKYRSSL